MGIATIVPNLLWLLGSGSPLESIRSFGTENYEAFMTNALAPLNVFFTNLLLYGFWGERYEGQIVLPGEFFSYWYIV